MSDSSSLMACAIAWASRGDAACPVPIAHTGSYATNRVLPGGVPGQAFAKLRTAELLCFACAAYVERLADTHYRLQAAGRRSDRLGGDVLVRFAE